MAFFSQIFFTSHLTVGSHPRYQIEASDGEVELDVQLPVGERKAFMYSLWRSTVGGKIQSYEGFELSQFVMLHQFNGYLHCKVCD